MGRKLRRHLRLLGATIPALGTFLTRQALACPDCPTARVVRASVLDDEWGTNLLLLSLPLVVLVVLTALLYRIGIEPPDRSDARPRRSGA